MSNWISLRKFDSKCGCAHALILTSAGGIKKYVPLAEKNSDGSWNKHGGELVNEKFVIVSSGGQRYTPVLPVNSLKISISGGKITSAYLNYRETYEARQTVVVSVIHKPNYNGSADSWSGGECYWKGASHAEINTAMDNSTILSRLQGLSITDGCLLCLTEKNCSISGEKISQFHWWGEHWDGWSSGIATRSMGTRYKITLKNSLPYITDAFTTWHHHTEWYWFGVWDYKFDGYVSYNKRKYTYGTGWGGGCWDANDIINFSADTGAIRAAIKPYNGNSYELKMDKHVEKRIVITCSADNYLYNDWGDYSGFDIYDS